MLPVDEETKKEMSFYISNPATNMEHMEWGSGQSIFLLFMITVTTMSVTGIVVEYSNLFNKKGTYSMPDVELKEKSIKEKD
jgi:hemolysin-activating ACP:hemolysin acyltransferase